jgi:hypothetical protein
MSRPWPRATVLPSTEDPISTVLSTTPAIPAVAAPLRRAPRIALGVVAAVWVALLVAIVRQPIFLTTDMVSNHVHIWYIAEQIWHGHGIPLRMPVLASGDAWAFPYGFLPWLAGALLWPLGGDHVVTALLVAGAAAVVAATYWALPRLRHGWWAVVVLINPSLVASVMLGQLPFLWAAAAFMTAIGMWRRGRPVVATVLAAISLATHPAVMLPVSLIAIAFALAFGRNRRRLLVCWLIAVAVAVPATLLTLSSPVVGQTPRSAQLAMLLSTVLIRVLVLAEPVMLDALASRWSRITAIPVSFAALGVVLIALAWQPFQLYVGWSGVTRTHAPSELATFTTTAALQPGRIYRVLPGADQKYGLYQVVRHGAVLDSELFPESLRRKGFSSDERYASFLLRRRIQSVIVTPGYQRHFHSNEPEHLASLARSGACVSGIRVTTGVAGRTWQEYDVSHC